MEPLKIADLRERLDGARSALAEARWDAALELLRGCEDWPIEVAEHAVLVKADTLTRRDAAEALVWLAATQDIVDSPEATFERELLTGRAYANVRNFDAAAVRFDRAHALVKDVSEGPARHAYQVARLRWFQREAQPTDADVQLALTDSDPSRRASAYAVRAWTFGSNGDYAAQKADLCTALACVEPIEYRGDIGAISMIVHTLARIAFETADTEAIAIARKAFERIRWTDDVRVERFQTLRSLGLDSFMRGESAKAQWYFRDAAAVAPSPAWKCIAHLDRAHVARVGHNEAWALDELSEAVRIAHGVAWGQTFGEERAGLVMLAILLAPVDAAEAQRYAATYSMLGTESVSPTLALSRERRNLGWEKYARGLIDTTLGSRETALANLRVAYDVYAPIEHHYMAAQIAAALGQLTGDAGWIAKAAAHAAKYPGAPAGPKAGEPGLRSDATLDSLSPLQRQIARAHWSGLDIDGLSRRFSRSLYTVERHLSEIYAAFGVASAAALRDEALRRGIA
jgi:tetratricopeptide (TPR) repeat protein